MLYFGLVLRTKQTLREISVDGNGWISGARLREGIGWGKKHDVIFFPLENRNDDDPRELM